MGICFAFLRRVTEDEPYGGVGVNETIMMPESKC